MREKGGKFDVIEGFGLGVVCVFRARETRACTLVLFFPFYYYAAVCTGNPR